MLSYQHIYHAGNAADVHKHLWLIRVLSSLKKGGQGPLFWLDTHGGRGLYDLGSKEAQKLGEYREGFLKFRDGLKKDKISDDTVRLYLKIVDEVNRSRKGFYPGSALISARLMGPSDRLQVCEMHKGEIEHLSKTMKAFGFARVEKEDGYKALAALPPAGFARGGVLIDPSYEVKTEYMQVLEAVRDACARWPEGAFLVWYPLLPAGHHAPMVEGFRTMAEAGADIVIDETLFRQPGEEGRGLYGSGMIVVNLAAVSGN